MTTDDTGTAAIGWWRCVRCGDAHKFRDAQTLPGWAWSSDGAGRWMHYCAAGWGSGPHRCERIDGRAPESGAQAMSADAVTVSIVVRENGMEPVEYVRTFDRWAMEHRIALAYPEVAGLTPEQVQFGDLLWHAAQVVLKNPDKQKPWTNPMY